MRRSVPRFQDANLERNLTLVKVVGDLGAARGATAAQMALAWLLAQGPDIVPIPGTKRRAYLDENLAATGITLSVAELSRIDDVFRPGAASGERYSQEMMRLVDRG